MVTIWHNPRCGKSREGLKTLEEQNIEFETLKYLDTPPSKDELASVIKKLGIHPKELVRTKEAIYKELGLKNRELSEEEWIEVISEHPKLIERPVVIKDDRAVIGRPASKIVELLKS